MIEKFPRPGWHPEPGESGNGLKGVETLNAQNSTRFIDRQFDQFVQRHSCITPRDARRDRPEARRSWGSFFNRREP